MKRCKAKLRESELMKVLAEIKNKALSKNKAKKIFSKSFSMQNVFPALRRNLYLISATYLLLITCAELMTIYDAKTDIALHAIILFALLLHSALEYDTDKNLSRFLMALVLAPLIRILSLSMPLVQFSWLSWFMLISIPIFIAIFTCMWLQELRPEDVGLFTPHLRNTPIEAGVILLAIPFGIMEYQILKPAPLLGLGLASASGAVNFIAVSLIFIVCTGFIEEFAFRGLLQYNAIRLMSKWSGILFVATVFGVLHVGNLTILDCLLAFSVGFIYSIVREKTGSIYGISVSHGIINTILFLVAPLYF